MIFNRNYNNILKLAAISSDEFKNILSKILKNLPKNIVNSSKKNESIEIDIENISYEFKSKENKIRLVIDNMFDDPITVLKLKEIDPNKLKNLKSSPPKTRALEEKEEIDSIKFCNLKINNNKEIEYDFEIRKINEKEYCVVMDKSIDLVLQDERIIKNYTIHELQKYLKLKIPKK